MTRTSPSSHRRVADLVTVGVTGQPWRASVTPWGAVIPWGADADGDAPTVDWHVAADDRWRSAAVEPAVRQTRIAGTPVIETRMRVPDGDAVHRVWSVAGSGGFTVIEIENDSPLAFAVAFSGPQLVTERPVSNVPIQGIDLPSGSISLPVGHHASIRVALPHDTAVPRAAVTNAPPADAVARGWRRIADRASRLDLPDAGLSTAVVSARCDLMLEGPVDATEDPVGFVLDVGELVRLGEDADQWLPEIVEPLAEVASGRRGADALSVSVALEAAARIADAAGDDRAGRDIERMRQRMGDDADVRPLAPFAELRRTGSVGRFTNDVEQHIVRTDRGEADLLPAGIPRSWMGADFEVHGVPTSPLSSVSFAVRWHGERPAVLWEQHGEPVVLRAAAIDDAWSTDAASGEALWAMRMPRSRGLTVRDSDSFS